MSGIAPVEPVNANAAPADPNASGADAQMQQAFAEGIARFMGTMLMSMESDIQEACNDTTSDPDAPS